MNFRTLACCALLLTCSLTWGQEQKTDDMPGMGMSTHTQEPSVMPPDHDGSISAMHSMSDRHMDMGPHMKMTTLRDIQPGDQEKADKVVEAARKVSEKYQDYKVALADGYKIFLPNVPQKQYHFTNYYYGFEAAMHFNPDHPTSLLYEKQDDGYKLIGVMYTAPKHASEDELNSRIPLSIAQWHAHVNLCIPPDDRRNELFGPHPKFGLAGSISTRLECDAEGGRFVPQMFGWMVHVYPFEKDQAAIWSVERQIAGHTHID